jgi:regulator of sirC expression with transglutaminase-like and TPR domain
VTSRSRRTFEELITLPDLEIPLAEAALLLACEEYPQLTLAPYLDELDRMAGTVRKRLQDSEAPSKVIDTINRVLFDEYRFRGNTEDYYDPRNSFLNDVIDRRVGIPITLSAIYIEVAQRLGVSIEGVGIPGHFVVRYRTPDGGILLDPFNRGSVVTREECRRIVENLNFEIDEGDEGWLRRVSNRQILVRMLNNLKVIYLKAGTFDKALVMVELMVLAEPDAAELYRERGLLRLQMRQFKDASRDLEHYLNSREDIEDRSQIEDYLIDLRRIRAMMN